MPLTTDGLHATLTAFAEECIQLFRPGISNNAGQVMPALRLQLGGQCMVVIAAVVMNSPDGVPPLWSNRGKWSCRIVLVTIQDTP